MDQTHTNLLVEELQQRAVDHASHCAIEVDLFIHVVAGRTDSHEREDTGPAEVLERFNVSEGLELRYHLSDD